MLRYVIRVSVAAALVFALATLAAAQYPGPGMGGGGMPGSPTYTPPRGGYSSAGPAVAGAAGGAAAIGGFLYWKHHYRAKLQGCVAGDGDKLVSEQNNETYSLNNRQGKTLKPGERMELLGTKTKTQAGEPSFEVRKIGKDFGACSATTAGIR
jgi:hypothetical protein